ncbi:MAG: serine O-acetyltransferase EpsC [Acutalibacteraceae bacterium]
MFDRLKADIATVRARDPAARSGLEIFLLYNGLKAVRSHRRAQWCSQHGWRFLARWISQRCVRRTNIEIHPDAKIGERLFIDHGTGVVIGETTEIGDDCTIYQGVTLGGTGKDKGKRHPTLGNNVMVGAGAKVLGPIHIGNNVRIAAGAVVLDNIPDNCTAVGVPARVVRCNGARIEQSELDQIHIPDPVSQELCRMGYQIEQLQKQLDALIASAQQDVFAERHDEK